MTMPVPLLSHTRRPFFVCWLWVGLLWLSCLTAANAAARIDVLAEPLNLARELHYLQSAPEATLAEVQGLPTRAWHDNRAGRGGFPNVDGRPFWFTFRLQGVAAAHDTVIRLDYPHHDYIDLYAVKDGKVLAHYQGGDRRPFAVRPVDNRVYLFPVDPRWGESVEVYLRVQSPGPMTLPLDVLTIDQLHHAERLFFLGTGIYFGLLGIMLVYNAFILAIVRQKAYAYYLAFIAVTTFDQYALFGFGFQHLWPDSLTLNNTILIFLSGLAPLSGVTYVASFLDIERIGTRVERGLSRLLILTFSLLTLGTLVLPYATSLKLGALATFAAIQLGIYLGVKYWYLGVKSARVFAIAWFVYMVFIFLFVAHAGGHIDSTPLTRNAFTIGSALELALLSIAFADRMNEEKNLRLRAQQDLLQAQVRMTGDLELRVRERTEALEEANRKLQEISITDGLTGLRNRRHFDTLFSQEYQRAYREKTWVAVLMVDIDHFKKLNDRHGHQIGDLCLRTAGRLIGESINRPSDLAARYGGEEFVVLLPATTLTGAVNIARQIHQRFADTVVESGDTRLTMTVSIGVAAQVPAVNGGRDLLLKLADERLYQAKAAGRNRVRWEDGEGAAALAPG